ncbi:MAG TPA: UDP-2,3-diacylglucosamine diphosphatase [Chitinophagaceae bacterium]|nr:UDP-2,3-diacylglucosamine diphosphatase [Chitinophagaceae bacterium]MCC6635196.1 UDP-2,3-diacylglucosamine diphosphatase [Chitinophagaceae bacterium]HMZ47021.1 UDP-2,3-diacylglucosamine diphosphatase [Chitinophagaceae bacterium]HNE93549.1 UDP-2,3-diacylglucosamine diphosphatase [Chitinophagaceae bacterium]HNF29612.1 UDP-2,3-diacylglucosamine diphosphatase [Chitinophagaceae bacterium]
MTQATAKNIYFLSDFHLGAPNFSDSLLREKKIVAFLDSIKNNATEVFILGDMFDFWFEYKNTVPKGFTRILGKLAELTDSGIVIHFFVGNHDMWMKDYFKTELNIKVYFEPIITERFGKKLYIAHGDGLGPGDKGYKFLKKIFRNKICQWMFGILHPTWGIGLANYFSRKSREKTGTADAHFLGEENEWLFIYSKEQLQKQPIDYFIFGHRHYPIKLAIENSYYVNLGDWINNFTYVVLNNETLELKKWEN